MDSNGPQDEDPHEWEPDVAFRLSSELYDYQDEAEQRWASPSTAEETVLHSALDLLEQYALSILTTGEIPDTLKSQLDSFDVGSSAVEKVASLLAYNVSLERLEFAIGHEIVDRLDGVKNRLKVSLIAFLLLLRSQPSETAVKYFERAVKLFLAGYTTETIVMCGAVLEAAMTACFPDDMLSAERLSPSYKRTGVFSLGQRMRYEEKHPIFRASERDLFWKVVNWRNDAVHVQPDLVPDPAEALLYVAKLLSVMLPRVHL